MSLFFDPATFWLVATRLSGFLVSVPGVGDFNIPRVVRAALVLWLTIFLMPQIPPASAALANAPDSFFKMVTEFLAGMGLGLITRLILGGVQLGGILIDSELGFMAAGQLNPANPISGGIFSRLMMMLGLFYFWSLDYFPLLLMALRESFIMLPAGTLATGIGDGEHMFRLGAGIFVSGVILAAPSIALGFCITVAIGFLARAVQGINIFFENFTLKIIVGLIGVLGFLPLLLYLIRVQLEQIIPETSKYFQGLAAANGL